MTTPYRSTIAITSLALFIAKCKGLVVPEGDFGSDVEGIEPIVFDVGHSERKIVEALEYCHKQLGKNATVLYDYVLPDSIEKMVEEQGKEAGLLPCWRLRRLGGLESGWRRNHGADHQGKDELGRHPCEQ